MFNPENMSIGITLIPNMTALTLPSSKLNHK